LAELAIKDLKVRYGSVEALAGVSLEVHDGECIGVLGPNGAGKSSLFRAISRLVPSEGEIYLDGEPVAAHPEEVVRDGIVQVLEGRQIFSSLTVKENLLLAKYAGVSGFSERYDAVLDFFPILQPKLKSLGGQLSGGQQQILAIARALACGPRVLMMDEPSLGLAPVVVDQLEEAIPRIRSEWNTTVVLADQFVRLVLSVAERVYVLSKGRVVHAEAAEGAGLLDALVTGYLGRTGENEEAERS
jgi:branched-chain amino acid transport system ATP-binding protein